MAEVPTTAGKEGHTISGHTTLSQLAVLGRTFCTVLGRGHYPRPRQQRVKGAHGGGRVYIFFFFASRKALALNGSLPVHTVGGSTRWAEWLLLSHGLNFVDAVPGRVPLTYETQSEA